MTEFIDTQIAISFLRVSVEAINPILLVSIFSEVIYALSQPNRRVSLVRAILFCIVACMGIAVPVVLAELGKKYQVWNGHPGFPSGHTTFAAAASAVIVAYRGKNWLLLGIPCTVIMMIGLVHLKFHDRPEVLAGLLLGATLGTVITRLLIGPYIAKPLDVSVKE